MQTYVCKGRSGEPHGPISLYVWSQEPFSQRPSLRAPKRPLSTRCPADHTCEVILLSVKTDHGHSSTSICWLLMPERPLLVDLSLTHRHNLRFHSVGCSVFKTEVESQEGLWNHSIRKKMWCLHFPIHHSKLKQQTCKRR